MPTSSGRGCAVCALTSDLPSSEMLCDGLAAGIPQFHTWDRRYRGLCEPCGSSEGPVELGLEGQVRGFEEGRGTGLQGSPAAPWACCHPVGGDCLPTACLQSQCSPPFHPCLNSRLSGTPLFSGSFAVVFFLPDSTWH